VLGYNALDEQLLAELRAHQIALIEDVSESYGATFANRKLGTFGLASNFSFYYAHHLSTIEGGMVATDDEDLYRAVRMLRAHGLVRESGSAALRDAYEKRHPDLNPEFIFAFPAWNVRSTEINAVIGRSQLKRLDANNALRRRNLDLFLDNLDPELFRTDFRREGSCNYAFTLVLRSADAALCVRVMAHLTEIGVEFRRGTAGGGNQLRQPYLKKLLGNEYAARFPEVDHVHFYGFYIGNYPGLEPDRIVELCRGLNAVARRA
jgi:CDP-6-deoxy-D-xylo-4-hexulose-3-dehydrase